MWYIIVDLRMIAFLLFTVVLDGMGVLVMD